MFFFFFFPGSPRIFVNTDNRDGRRRRTAAAYSFLSAFAFGSRSYPHERRAREYRRRVVCFFFHFAVFPRARTKFPHAAGAVPPISAQPDFFIMIHRRV